MAELVSPDRMRELVIDGLRSVPPGVLRGGFMIVFLNFGVWLVMALNEGFGQVHPWWLWLALGWGGGLLAVQTIRKRNADQPDIAEARQRELG